MDSGRKSDMLHRRFETNYFLHLQKSSDTSAKMSFPGDASFSSCQWFVLFSANVPLCVSCSLTPTTPRPPLSNALVL